MDKLTLDTNVWRDWAWSEARTTEKRYGGDLHKKIELQQYFAELKVLREQCECSIANPIQVYLDFQKSGWTLPLVLKKFIAQHSDNELPVVYSVPLAFPFVFASEGEYEKLFAAIFPDSKQDDRNYESNQQDTMLLLSHIMAGQDIYITSDNAILRSNTMLQNNWSTCAMTLAEYLASKK